MATIQQLKTQIENANALGRTNLAAKGVELPETATTYEIMQGIGDVSSGSGASLNIAYGETPPEDTSKLWVKANEPANVSVGSDFEGIESITAIGNLPTSNTDMGCAKVGNKIYLFGGEGSSNLNTINLFDIETNGITTLTTKLPSICASMGCAAVGNKIYLFGGNISDSPYRLNTINVFDTETNRITTLTTKLPSICASMGCAAVGNKIYLFGGYSDSNLNTIRVFDTETNVITTLTTKLPTVCKNMGCAAVGNKIYLFGGWGSGLLNAINVFDTETNRVTTLQTTLPSANAYMRCAAVGTKIYIFGGYGSGFLNTINVFDTETEEITTLATTLTSGRRNMGCAAVGNKVYLLGGEGSPTTIEKFTVTHELAQGDIEIQSGLLKNKFNLINTDTAQIKIGVENVYIGNTNNEAEPVSAYLYNGTEWKQISYGA